MRPILEIAIITCTLLLGGLVGYVVGHKHGAAQANAETTKLLSTNKPITMQVPLRDGSELSVTIERKVGQ